MPRRLSADCLLLHDPEAGHWLMFSEPTQIVCTHEMKRVTDCLKQIEACTHAGKYAAGFISYEAAPAFDKALPVHPLNTAFPLLWFGIFDKPRMIESLPACPHEPEHFHWTPSVTRDRYAECLDAIKQHIRNGDTYQVNYTMRMRSDFSENPLNLFLWLIQGRQTKYAAYVDTGEFAVCSLSPELFFSLKDGTVEANPMKGTADRGDTLKQDLKMSEWLRNSAKNRAENVMIVDMMRNDIGRIAIPGTVEVPELFVTERYPTLWQMTSRIRARTEVGVSSVMQALFPCASITGAPKPRTMELIRELEPDPRQVYTGTIGWIQPGGNAQFSVAIRTVLIDTAENSAEYGVGGGIVWDSDTSSEYEECLLKTRILTDQPGEFQLFETMLVTPKEGIFLRDYHLRRLADSAEYFAITVKFDILNARLDKSSAEATAARRLRLLVTQDGEMMLEDSPLPESPPEPVRLGLDADSVDPDDPFLYHKTTNRGIYSRARERHPECDDVILQNKHGEITETTIANIVIEKDGELLTPAAECGLLPGTFRASLLDAGTIKEARLTGADLESCSKIFRINSLRKWQKACVVDL